MSIKMLILTSFLAVCANYNGLFAALSETMIYQVSSWHMLAAVVVSEIFVKASFKCFGEKSYSSELVNM